MARTRIWSEFTMPFHFRVFVGSSTVPEGPKEIDAYRWAARDAILSAGMKPIMYEHVHKLVTDMTPEELSRKMIDDSDIFLGIYSGQYGKHRVGEQDWAEYEYKYAFSKKMPRILFFPERDHNWLTQSDERFEAFIKTVPDFYQTFVDPQGLSAQLSNLLLAPKYRDAIAKRFIVEPIFGQPPAHSQYEADVFMIMPFKPDFTRVWLECIKPTVEELGFSIKRGDDFFSKHSIMDDIWGAHSNQK